MKSYGPRHARSSDRLSGISGRRVMTEADVRSRAAENAERTATLLRERVRDQLARQNGKA
jgi:hypothetical protein